jgi:hypothetical protein
MLISVFMGALCGCAAGGGASPAVPGARVAQAPQPSSSSSSPPQTIVRSHTLTWETAYFSASQYDATYGYANWMYVRPYVDLVLPSPNQTNANVQAAGISTSGYVDPNFCSGSYAVGPNPYASPNCATFPDDAFYHDGQGNPLTLSWNGTQQQRLGDPSSPVLQSELSSYVQRLVSAHTFNLIQIDDAQVPKPGVPSPLCWGVGTFGASGYSCAGAPGGAAIRPFDRTHTLADWKAGEAALAAAMPLPVIFNGLESGDQTGRSAPIASVAAAAPNVWGAMCETCFYSSSNPNKVAGPLLNSALLGTMNVVNAKRSVIVINDFVTDPGAREHALAEIMLIYDQNLLYEGGPCGAKSHIAVCPEASLVFTEAYKPYPHRLADLRDQTGNDVREFEACYQNGQYVGPCAAVVNPDLSAEHELPHLRNAYAHTLTISGTALCQCFGDTGSASVSGPPPPRALAPATGLVLFR